jgi:hypothetical protein
MGAQIPILTTVQKPLISGIGKGQEVQRTFFMNLGGSDNLTIKHMHDAWVDNCVECTRATSNEAWGSHSSNGQAMGKMP